MFKQLKEKFGMAKKRAKKPPKTLCYEELEQRVLFSADIMAGLESLAIDEQVLVEDVIGADRLAQEAAEAAIEQTAVEAPKELVFVNQNVPDYEQLIADLQKGDENRNLEVVLLEADRDGIEQVSEVLADRTNMAAVHFITHGSDGQINLGNSWLDNTTLQQNIDAVAGWGNALTDTGDFLFYGCNIAADSDGQTLLNNIAQLTGADVAASDDLTGNSQLGGDWELEYDQGKIETAVPINSEAQQNWSGVLATFNVTTTADGGAGSLRQAIIDANALGGANEIILDADIYTLSLGPAGDDAAAFGDLDVTSEITIRGADATNTVIDANSLDRVFHLIGNTANLTLNDLTVTGGNTVGDGGGIYVNDSLAQLTAERVIITGNIANNGAGIFNEGTISLTDVIISNNGNATTDEGGGIYNAGTAILERVTINGNHADFSGGDGGGIHNDDAGTSLSLMNVTVSGNTADDKGGGLRTRNPATILNSTFTLNSADSGGGISDGAGGTVNIKNTIVAENSASTDPDVDGSFNSQGYNLIGDKGSTIDFVDGVNGDQVGTSGSPVDPMLDSLKDNGGFTQTHALLAGSPAIDPAGISGAPSHDQRGFVRDVTSDIGAFEYNVANTAPTLTVTGAASVEEGAVYTLNLSASDPDSHTIIRWTINWGDGTIETIPGYQSSATHIYSNPGFTYNILVSAIDDENTPIHIHNDLFAGHYINNAGVYRIQGTWGAPPTEFATEGTLDKTIQPIIGPDGNLYVSGEFSGNVLRYNTATGAFIDVFADISGEAGGIAFGPDGNLYLADFTNREILRFNGSDGSAMGAFVTGIGGRPYGLTFGPDGNLYVGLYNTGEVLKYDGLSGTALGTFVGGLGTPEQIIFGPDGHLYIADVDNDSVRRFNGTDGTPMGDFIAGTEPNLDKPNGLAFGPDGNLYVSDSQDGVILRYNGSTGAFIDEYVDGLDLPSLLAFAPDLQVYVTPNAPPTLSSFIGPVTSGDEDSEITITFGDLALQGDEADSDGTVDAFIVKSVTSGTLRIGADAVSATAWVADSNDTLNATTHAYWTPDPHANGTLDAFEVVAQDDDGAESATNVTAQVTVNPINDAPTLSGGPYNLGSTDEDNASTGVQVSTILGGLTSSDADGDTLGIAVVTASGNSNWQYSTNSTDGTDGTWTAFGSVNANSALLLSESSWVRYVPDGLNGENVNIDFHAWDGTTGTASVDGTPSTADPAGGGGTTAYSSGIATANLTVTDQNDAPTLTVTGAASVTQGTPYTLNLSASDPDGDIITSWTINWGDGAVETFAGNPSSVTHTYTQAGFTYDITVSATDVTGTYISGDLISTSLQNDRIYWFDPNNPLINTWVDVPGVGNEPLDVQFGPDGEIYVTGFVSNKIFRYNADGSFDTTFVDGSGLSGPARMAFGPDGNLYVTNLLSNEVLRFSGVDGTSNGVAMGAFISTGLDQPDGIAFGPDGNLYVANNGTGNVLRFDGVTGALDPSFTANGPSGYMDIQFGPDGRTEHPLAHYQRLVSPPRC